MEHGHAAPISTLAFAVTLCIGVLLVAPDAPAPRADQSTAQSSGR